MSSFAPGTPQSEMDAFNKKFYGSKRSEVDESPPQAEPAKGGAQPIKKLMAQPPKPVAPPIKPSPPRPLPPKVVRPTPMPTGTTNPFRCGTDTNRPSPIGPRDTPPMQMKMSKGGGINLANCKVSTAKKNNRNPRF